MTDDKSSRKSFFESIRIPEAAVTVGAWCAVAIAILFFTALLLGYTVNLGTLGAVSASRASAPVRLQLQAWRLGPDGPVQGTARDGWDSELFKTQTRVPRSSEYIFCSLSSTITKDPSKSSACELLEHGNNDWSITPTNATCKVTCFKQVM